MLYYSGAIKPEDTQTNPELSLGGFKSSTQIPNGEIHNVFPKITRYSLANNSKVIRLIILANPTSAKMSDVKIWSENGSYSIVKIAAVAPGFDTQCSRYFFEKVANDSQIPYQGTLVEYSESSPLNVGDIEIGAMIGVWVRRELDLTKFSNTDKGEESESCDVIVEELSSQNNSSTVEEDNIKLHFEWN